MLLMCTCGNQYCYMCQLGTHRSYRLYMFLTLSHFRKHLVLTESLEVLLRLLPESVMTLCSWLQHFHQLWQVQALVLPTSVIYVSSGLRECSTSAPSMAVRIASHTQCLIWLDLQQSTQSMEIILRHVCWWVNSYKLLFDLYLIFCLNIPGKWSTGHVSEPLTYTCMYAYYMY